MRQDTLNDPVGPDSEGKPILVLDPGEPAVHGRDVRQEVSLVHLELHSLLRIFQQHFVQDTRGWGQFAKKKKG